MMYTLLSLKLTLWFAVFKGVEVVLFAALIVVFKGAVVLVEVVFVITAIIY